MLTQTLVVAKDGVTVSAYPGEAAGVAGSTIDTANLLNMLYVTGNNVQLIGLEIQGGSYYGVKIESNTGTAIRNCHIHDTGRDNVKMYLADNALFDGCDMGPTGVRDPSDAQCINAVACNGAEVRHCHFHDSANNGVYFKGGSSGCVVEQNLIERCAYSGILLGQDTDLEFMRGGTQYEAINCVARNNVIVAAGGAGLGTYSGSNVRFENNTLYDVARQYNGGLYIAWNSRNVPSRQIAFENNIVVVTSARPLFYSIALSDQIVSDANLYYRPSGGSYGFWMENGSTANYWTNITAWQSGTGADQHSIVGDPRLDSANLYRPVAGSPAIDHGIVLADVSIDYAGTTRPQGSGYDIGAFEIPSSQAPQPPRVSITASATSGVAPMLVNFGATVTSDAGIASYLWDFGDAQTSTAVLPSHSYIAAGTFVARLTVTDSSGLSGSATVTISVSAAPGHLPPQISITASPTTGTAPLTVNFESTASASSEHIATYQWSFGDGGISASASPQHIFATAGTFAPRLTVTDDAGATATASVSITVNPGVLKSTQPVQWTNVAGSSVSNGVLTKTAESMWGNAGATSAQSIQSGNGYVEFTADETDKERMCGLSVNTDNHDWTDIAFAAHLNTGGAFYVVESGASRGYFGDYSSGDVFRVSLEAGIIRYYRNGSLFYTSGLKPSYPLRAAAALDGSGATIAGAVISSRPEPAANVLVLAPAAAAVVKAGATATVSWSLSPISGQAQVAPEALGGYIDVLLSIDGGASWISLATALPASTAGYSWTVPSIKTSNAIIQVNLTATDGATASGTSGSFTIKKKRQ
jgi:PKD repeat protein